MNPWLVSQAAYAIAAWYVASKAVARLYYFGGLAGRGLAATVRELRLKRRAAEVPRLMSLLGSEALGPLLDLDADATSAEELVAAAQTVAADAVPPIRLLRAMATIGTTLGLLAAVATLRAGLDGATGAAMELAASRAFDSAVAGFVTALPCWTAIGLCRQRNRALLHELELTVLAQRAAATTDATATSGTHETVDGHENAE